MTINYISQGLPIIVDVSCSLALLNMCSLSELRYDA